MSDNVLIVLIVAIALIIVLFIFRKQLSNFRFRGGKEGVDMEIKTRKETVTNGSSQSRRNSNRTSVSRNKLWGRGNKINVQKDGNVTVDDNQLVGEDQGIDVKTEKKSGR